MTVLVNYPSKSAKVVSARKEEDLSNELKRLVAHWRIYHQPVNVRSWRLGRSLTTMMGCMYEHALAIHHLVGPLVTHHLSHTHNKQALLMSAIERVQDWQ